MTPFVTTKAFITEEQVSDVASSIFAEGNPIVKQKLSALGKAPLSYLNAKEIADEVCETPRVYDSFHYAIFYPCTQGALFEERVNVEYENVRSFRYNQQGWGVIEVLFDYDDDFRFEATNTIPVKCWLSCFTLRQANESKKFAPNLRSPEAWDWNRVSRHVKRIDTTLRRLTNED